MEPNLTYSYVLKPFEKMWQVTRHRLLDVWRKGVTLLKGLPVVLDVSEIIKQN